MVDYKPRTYTGNTVYTPTKDVSKMDPRIRLYQPQNPIRPQDIGKKPRTYDTKPPRYIQTRTYEKVRTYDSYSEYIPPWSRGKEKAKRERPPPKPKPEKTKAKPVPDRKAVKVTFAADKRSPLPAIGSIKRTMMLFDI